MNQLLMKIETIPIEIFFVAAGLFFGVSVAMITPPFQAPDEHNHFSRAYQVSEGQLISEKIVTAQNTHIPLYEYVNLVPRQDQSVASGGELPLSLAVAFETASKGIEFYAERKYEFNNTLTLLDQPLNANQKIFFHFANTAVYSPVPYIAPAMGIAFGRIFDASPLVLMYLGRISTLTVWLFAVYFALKLAPFNKHLLLLLALMPMSLFLASSLSADACLNGFSFLFMAMTFKMACQCEDLHPNDFIQLFVVALIITLSKMAYLPLVGATLAIPLKRATKKKPIFCLISAGIIACVIAGVSWINIADRLYVPYVPFSSSREQLNFILENPGYFFSVILNIANAPGLSLIAQYIGIMGWLDTGFPTWFYVLYFLAIILVVISEPKTAITTGIADKVIVALSLLCSFLLVVATVYLYWTPVGLDKVALQGRYFIPLGPFLVILLVNRFRMVIVPYRNTALFSFCLFSLCLMVWQLISRYYLY